MSALVYKPRIAFQGEHGAFGEDAAIELFGPRVSAALTGASVQPSKHSSIVLMPATQSTSTVPIENSLIGSIRPAVDLFEKSSLAVVGSRNPNPAYLIGCRVRI